MDSSSRITPAGAGKTVFPLVAWVFGWDHPRRCGENTGGRNKGSGKVGSPPQVRGKPETKARRAVVSRITPAGAGKTNFCFCGKLYVLDHPRRCGENFGWICPRARFLGSPPQVRGKRYLGRGLCAPPRITPAGAGKTKAKPIDCIADWDHPRRCGENM